MGGLLLLLLVFLNDKKMMEDMVLGKASLVHLVSFCLTANDKRQASKDEYWKMSEGDCVMLAALVLDRKCVLLLSPARPGS